MKNIRLFLFQNVMDFCTTARVTSSTKDHLSLMWQLTHAAKDPPILLSSKVNKNTMPLRLTWLSGLLPREKPTVFSGLALTTTEK